MLRRLLVSVALMIGLLTIAATGLIVFRVALAEALISSQLASFGLPTSGIKVAALDLRHMVVTDIALGRGDELSVEAVTLTYSPDRLLAGQLEEVVVDGLRVRLDLTGAGPPLGSLQPLLQERDGAGAGGVGMLPSAVILSRGRIEVAAPAGDLAAAVFGRWQPLAGTATLALTDLAVPHLAFETSRLDIEATRDRITATATARGENDAVDLDLHATVESYLNDPKLALALESGLTPAAWDTSPLPRVEEGKMSLSLQVEGQLPPIRRAPGYAAALNWLLGADLHGKLRASLSDVAYRDRARGISGAVDLAVTVADGDLNIEIAEGGRLRIARVDPVQLDAIGAAAVMPRLRDAAVALAIPVGNAPLLMRLRPNADGADLAVSGGAEIAIAETTLEIQADGILALDKDYTVRGISFPQTDMHLRELALAGHRIEQLHATGAIDGTPRDLKGTADLTAELAAMRIETVTVGAATSNIAASFHWTGNRLELRQSGNGSVSVASIGLGDAAKIARPVTALLTDGALTFSLTPNGPTYSHAIAIRPKRMTVELPRPDAAPLAIRANIGPVRLEGRAEPGIPYRGLLTLNRGRLAIPDQALSAEAVSASLAVPSVAGERLVKFAIGRLRHTSEPAYFAPLWVNGNVTRQEDSFVLKAAGANGTGALRFSVSGRYGIEDGHGTMQIRIPETAFGKDALQPVHLSPLLAGVREVTGRFGATAEFGWRNNGIVSKGALDLAGISFLTDLAAVEGLSSRISLDGLLPPSTPAGQEISVQRVDPALPIDDVVVRFQIEPAQTPRLRLHEATARFAGGRISVAEAVIDISRSHNFVDVGVGNLDLELLLSLLQVEDVSATGRLSGTIPLDIADAGVAINNGQLAAQGPGVMRIRSEAAASALGGAGEQVALMLSALEDFHYDTLSATLDMGNDGEAAVMIHMEGQNPAVLDGYPFAFNTGLSGNLTKLLGALRQGAQLSTDLVTPQIR